MKIAIVGPAHPYKGGIAQHTTELAHHLRAAGHEVEIISWRTQYPFFYPGAQFVPDNKPEIALFKPIKRVLSWKSPAGWWRWGRRLRGFDLVIFIWWVPTIQGPVYRSMLAALGSRARQSVIICHNVLPHEARPGDKRLARSVLGRVGKVIVHSDAQATLAGQLTTSQIIRTDLPLIIQSSKTPAVAQKAKLSHELLFFGIIRPYKGVDMLLKALAQVPDIKLTIAGEFWSDDKPYRELVDSLGIGQRVTIRAGYVPADSLSAMISQADAVVLPYRAGTATWNVALAHAYGTPVIATTAGTFALQVRNEIDGLLCQPDDVASLAKALKRFYEPGVAKKLRAGVPKPKTDDTWQAYLRAITKS